MKQVACGQCNQSRPMNEMLSVLGRSLCKPCAESELTQHPDHELPQGAVARQVDPTICAHCQADNGSEELPTLGAMPVCAACELLYRNRPYPVWLKATFASLLALVVFSFAWNWRFLAAYREVRQARRALQSGNIELAADLNERAARRVPESEQLKAEDALSQGLLLLSRDESARAVKQLQKARSYWPQDATVNRLLLTAEGNAAFDAKNYDEFLVKMQALAALAPRDASAVAGVSSAYACKYAVTGSDQFRNEALHQLDLAATLAKPDDPGFQEYKVRIHHRLDTREIISRAEYQRRFPDGYNTRTKP